MKRFITVDAAAELIESVLRAGWKSDRLKCVSGIPEDAVLRGAGMLQNGDMRVHFSAAATPEWPEGSTQVIRPVFEKVFEADGM